MLVDFEPQRKQKRTYTGSDVDNRLKTMYSIAEKRRGPGEAQSLRESAESGDLSKWTIYEPGNMFVLQMLYGRDPFVYGKNGAGIWTPKTQKDKELYFSDEAEATRNRRKSYLRRVSEHIDTTRYPTILSIGGGAGTEHIDFLREHPEKLKNTKVAVVDLNLEAVKRGNNWAEEQGFGDNILFVRGDAKKVGEYLNRMLPLLGRDEITCTTTEGLMDYMKPEDFQRIAKCSKQFMPKGSGFHTSNMARIGEICEYMNSGGWGTQNMLLRDGKFLREQLEESGFSNINVEEIYGFHKNGNGPVHYIADGASKGQLAIIKHSISVPKIEKNIPEALVA